MATSNGVANGAAVDAMRREALSPAELRALKTPPQGTSFSPRERLFAQYDNGLVFAYGEWDAARVSDALRKDGQLRSLEQILTLPIRAATWEIVPEGEDAGQAELVRDTLSDKLPLLIAQATSAIAYKKAFFETTWTVDDQGRVVYDDIAFRPALGCDAGWDPKTAKAKGFRQRIVPVGGVLPTAATASGSTPGYVLVQPQRSFIYTHGEYREPIQGVSDLDVALWVHDTKLKVLFLLGQFLENQALPKTIVWGDSEDEAEERAAGLAQLKSSGVLGLARTGDPSLAGFDLLESSGRGAAQFQSFLMYLDSQMSASVLSGFTDLPQAAVQGTGSYALSADQTETFLASRQAVADELADAIRRDVFGPLVAYNYGPKAPVPRLKIGPLSSAYAQRGMDLLKTIVAAPYANLPRGIVEQLVAASASFLGLDPAKVQTAVDEAEADIAAARAAEAAATTTPDGAAPESATGRSAESGLYPQLAPWRDTQPAKVPPKLAAVGLAVDTLHGLVSEQLRGS